MASSSGKRASGLRITRWMFLLSLFLTSVTTLTLGVSAGQIAWVPDLSLGVDEYQAMGFPSLDREWSVAEYRTSLVVLSQLRREQLPRIESPKSGSVFQKLAAENARFGQTLVNSARGGDSLSNALDEGSRADGASSIEELYSELIDSELGFDREFVELRGARLKSSILSLPSQRELMRVRDELLSARPVARKSERTELLLQTNSELITTVDTFTKSQLLEFVQLAASSSLDYEARVRVVQIFAEIVDQSRRRIAVESEGAVSKFLQTVAESIEEEGLSVELKRLSGEFSR